MRLITGPRRQTEGRARPVPLPSVGSTAWSRDRWSVRTSVMAIHAGPQAAARAALPRNDPPGGVAGCGGLGQGGRQPAGPGNHGVPRLCHTVIASVDCSTRCLVERKRRNI